MVKIRKLGLKLALCTATLVLLAGLGASTALADTSDFCLTVGNAAISGYTGPYVCVSVNRTSDTTATITFDSQTVAGNIYLMGDGSSVGLNVNASSFTASAVGTNSLSGFTPGGFTNNGSGNVDGFGTFNFRVTDFDGFTHSATQIVVSLTNTGGTWASASDVLFGNAGGNTAVAHIFVCDVDPNPCTGSSTALATGFAANGSPVPEPASLTLMGLGLLGLGTKLRKKFIKK